VIATRMDSTRGRKYTHFTQQSISFRAGNVRHNFPDLCHAVRCKF
jgi:hypothetical protein